MWKETPVKEWTIQDFTDFYASGEMDSNQDIVNKLGYLAAYKDLPFESEWEDEFADDTHRWTGIMDTIWLIDGEYYLFPWDKRQHYYSPFKVKQVKKVVETTEWVCADE